MIEAQTAPWQPFADPPRPVPPWQDRTGTWHLSRWSDVSRVLSHDQVQVDHSTRDKLERITRAFPHKYGAWRLVYQMLIFSNGDEHQQLRRMAASMSGDLHRNMPGSLLPDHINRALHRPEIDIHRDFSSPLMDEWCATLFDTSVDDMQVLRRTGFEMIFNAEAYHDVNAIEHQAHRAITAYAQAMNRPTAQMDQQDQATLFLAVFAFSTLAALCSNTLAYLADHPTLQEELRAQPRLRAGFLREAERLLTPLRYFDRITGDAPIALGDITLPPHSPCTIDMVSANCDPALCADPQVLDPARPRCAHMSFAMGPHRCLGIQASRQFMITLLDSLLPIARVVPGAGHRQYETNTMLRSPRRVPLRFQPLRNAI